MTQDLNQIYGLNPAHSEVVEACQTIAPCDVLDMGCGTGRNALYLGSRGFDVTAVDINAHALDRLQSVIDQEGLANVRAVHYDIGAAQLDADYDFIACTVTLMFIDAARVPAVLSDMQQRTRAGGYNVIVCAMDTVEYPCPMNFPFTFQPGQLQAAYEGWDLVKYNEDPGTMHNGARLQFATLLARKPA